MPFASLSFRAPKSPVKGQLRAYFYLEVALFLTACNPGPIVEAPVRIVVPYDDLCETCRKIHEEFRSCGLSCVADTPTGSTDNE